MAGGAASRSLLSRHRGIATGFADRDIAGERVWYRPLAGLFQLLERCAGARAPMQQYLAGVSVRACLGDTRTGLTGSSQVGICANYRQAHPETILSVSAYNLAFAQQS